MKIILLFFFVVIFPVNVFAQMEIDGKPLNEEQKKMVKEAFSKNKILAQNAEITCKCIDSISVNNKNADDTSKDIKKCIDDNVVGYQTTLKLMATVDAAQDENVNVTIFTNQESIEYKKYYYEIERQVMDSCPAIKNVVGVNNKEAEKSISKKSLAIREYNQANEFLRQNDYANALPFFEKAVKIDPEFVFAWDNIGVCYRRLGNYDKSLMAYRMSLKLDPKNLTALQNVPLAYVGKKEYKKAIKAYGDLEKVDKDNPEIYYGMGVVYFENIKDNEKALENMCKAYILYIAQNSPYRTDAENVIQKLYSEFKQNGQIEKFNQILNLFNITPN